MTFSSEVKQKKLSTYAVIEALILQKHCRLKRNLLNNFIYQDIIKIHSHLVKDFAVKL